MLPALFRKDFRAASGEVLSLFRILNKIDHYPSSFNGTMDKTVAPAWNKRNPSLFPRGVRRHESGTVKDSREQSGLHPSSVRAWVG